MRLALLQASAHQYASFGARHVKPSVASINWLPMVVPPMEDNRRGLDCFPFREAPDRPLLDGMIGNLINIEMSFVWGTPQNDFGFPVDFPLNPPQQPYPQT